MNHTEKLKAALWQLYGDPAFPSEWDGNVYGGGKLSQRFWEYFTTIELLDLTPDSVVLDIGGGSPVTGAGFFTRLIAPHVKEVHVMDVNIGKADKTLANIKFHAQLGSYETLAQLLKEHPHITHVACISVFEHIPHEVRCGMVKAINEHFVGNTFVATLEYHARERFFEHQLTVRTLSWLCKPFTNFYPDEIRNSPMWCESAYSKVPFMRRVFRKLGMRDELECKAAGFPLWYPLALRFARIKN